MPKTVHLCPPCLFVATHSNGPLLRVEHGTDGTGISSKLCQGCVINMINALGLVQTTAAAQPQ
jgi:hypothetical protein